MKGYTETEILYIKELYYEHGTDWETITKKFNKAFKDDKSVNALRVAYSRYGDMFEITDNDRLISVLKDARRTKKRAAQGLRNYDLLVENQIRQEDILEGVKQAVRNINSTKRPPGTKPKRSKQLSNMTIELLVSDLHYGKLTGQFNAEIARDRMRQFSSLAIEEIQTHAQLFNIDRVIIALMGDIIESYTMHGLESAMSSEMGNSEQIMLSIESLMVDLIEPVAELGYPIYVPCVTGNHDRTERDKTFNLVGRQNVTWIIYNTLRLLCEARGYKDTVFEIVDNPYLLVDIYNNTILYEHGDLIKNTNKKTIEGHVANRQKQLNRVIDFFRMGHYHEVTMYEQGRIIINGCLTGQDSYADVCGFNTQAYQIINYYIETDNRPNCFYKSFPAYLK